MFIAYLHLKIGTDKAMKSKQSLKQHVKFPAFKNLATFKIIFIFLPTRKCQKINGSV